MSLYKNETFVSPLSLYARIKEEMRSYFDSGAVDDLLFPLWTNDCIQKFEKGLYKINHALLRIKDFKAELPCDFDKVREAWMCTEYATTPYQSPSAHYYIKDYPIEKDYSACDVCSDVEPEVCTLVHKVTQHVYFKFKKSYLLKPGNDNAASHCGSGCSNFGSSAPDTFDIRDGKMVFNFREGDVYLLYYAKTFDDFGYQLIPESYYIQDYIKKYIKFMIMDQLFNQTTDETFNQIRDKRAIAEQASNEAYVRALTWTKQETVYDKLRRIKKSYNRNNKFNID